jgi:ABC-2 type transport system ATP-binding protein
MMNLHITNLSKTYPNGVQALNRVNLTMTNGMFGLLGPNGAGKSTLMRIIATLQEADEGDIQLDDIDVMQQKNDVRRRLGYLPQEFGLYPEITAEQMLDHIAVLKGISRKYDRKKNIDFLLEQADLYDVRKQKLGSFSGGMKQRFGIVQALLGEPKMIIVDEPTAGLDPEGRNRFYNLLSDISENRIVILSTHIVDDVRVLCRQMAILHQGEVLLSGETNQAIDGLKGKIWEKIIQKRELAEYDDRFRIVLTRLLGGDVLIHVLSDTRPEGFTQTTPDLEDVYFYTIKTQFL